MEKTNLLFSLVEYKIRLIKVKMSMLKKGIDTLLITDPANMNWLTGYNAWSFYVHQGVVVNLEEEEPLWFGRLMDRNAALVNCWINEKNMIPYDESFVMNPSSHPMSDIAQSIFIKRRFDKGIIGVEMDNYYYSAQAHSELTSSLPNATFVNANALVNWQRAVKSTKELEYMQIAGKITNAMHQSVLNKAKIGVSKNKLVAEVYHTGISGVDGYGGDYPSIVPLIPSGKEASACHLTWDDRTLQNNQCTYFELSGCHNRYHAPLSRTLYFGKPEQKFLDAESALIEAIHTGLEQAKPGNKTSDIANALDAVMLKHGINRNGARCGYPIGLSYPPDWGERTMSLRSSDNTVLEEGMTFHFMPGIWQEDWGIEITESIVITDTGVDTLCEMPRKLFLK